jgi:rhodanese-related sulfurtransferase
MRSSNLLLGLMALACLLVQACAAEDSQELIDQNKVDKMNTQILGEKKTETNSYKGEPWATSSLNDSNQKTTSIETISPVQVTSVLGQSSDYMVKTDSFLKEAMKNGYYVLSVPEFVNRSVADKNWVIVDVRPAQLYATGHILGAINIPLSDLVSQMGMIPAGQKVAVYCELDTNAAFAVQTLRVYGDRDASVLLGGVVAWQAAGMPVAT